ncbi:MAG: hypothetical protein ACI37S_07505 [Candidatus Gastranaerophilaceae bacterium]
MGMAASQARYLGLTARKTNVEYEGQQINQARTALANQSANLWNNMLQLEVPVAPNKVDYTTQQYSFSDGFNEYEIDALQNVDTTIDGEKYNFLVTYHYNQDVYKGIQERNTNPQVQKIADYTMTTGKETLKVEKEGDNYKVTDPGTLEQKVFQPCTSADLNELKALAQAGKITIDDISNVQNEYYKTTLDDGKTKVFCRKEDLEAITHEVLQTGDLSLAQTIADSYKYKVGNTPATPYDATNNFQKVALEQIRHDFPALASVPNDKMWVYERNDKLYFASEDELNACMNSGSANQINNRYQISSNIDYQTTLNQYYANREQERITTTEYARLDDASGSGRFQNIKLSSSSGNFILNSEEKTHDEAYENAMQKYNYDVLQYEKRLAEINAKTSKIQVQDRTLELRLRQLDTEQKALTTEMEVVKQVIQKNIEMTFKTFSS